MSENFYHQYTHDNLLNWIRAGRNRLERRIEHNTTARIDGDNIVIRFHETDIAEILPDNTIILNSGGFLTYTTKDRMNKILSGTGWIISQNRGIWYLWNYGTKIEHVYQDGIIIHPDNSVSNTGINPTESIKLRNQIKRYSKRFISALCSGKVESPNPGDCWECCLRESGSNIPLGELRGDNDHLESHMRENCYVGSLFERAIEVYPISMYAMTELAELWMEKTIPTRFIVLPDQGYKSLLKYLYERFNLPH